MLQLSSCHIGLSPKSLECYYLVLYRKGLPTSDRTDTAWVFEQMLAWLKQKCSEIWNMFFFKPLALLSLWAVISAASIVVSIPSESGPAFGEDLQGTKMCCGRRMREMGGCWQFWGPLGYCVLLIAFVWVGFGEWYWSGYSSDIPPQSLEESCISAVFRILSQ